MATKLTDEDKRETVIGGEGGRVNRNIRHSFEVIGNRRAKKNIKLLKIQKEAFPCIADRERQQMDTSIKSSLHTLKAV